MDQNCQVSHPPNPVFPIQQPSQFVCQLLMTPWKMSLRNLTTHAHISFSWQSTRSIATSSLIRPATSPSHPTTVTHILLSSTSLTPQQFAPFLSRIAQKKNFSVHIARSMPGSLSAASNLSCINLTTKHPKTLKHLLPPNKLASSTLYWTSIAQTPPNGPYAPRNIIFLPAW